MPIIGTVGGSKSYGRAESILTSDTAIVGMYYQTWTSQHINSNTYAYERITDSEVTFTAKVANASYLLMQDISCYQSTTGQGSNGCFYVKIGSGSYTAIAAATHDGQASGYSSSSGMDGWMGGMHSAVASSWNHKKIWVWSPNVSAGTSLSVSCGFGVWGSTDPRVNYTGYGIASAMAVLEFKNPV